MMHIYNRHHGRISLFCLTATLLLGACSGQGPARVKAHTDEVLTWPPAPNEPRIEYIGSLSHPKDLGISKGFFDKLSEMALGEEHDGMVLPMAVVENGQKQLFVADPGTKTIHRFDRKRGRYKAIKRAGGKGFESPVGLAADKEGTIYIADSQLAKIFVLNVDDSEATPLALAEDLVRPTGIAIDRKTGWIFIVDSGVHAISVFSREMSLLRKIGRRGSGKGEFNFPTHIRQKRDGQFLVTDSLNFRVQSFDRHGRYIGQFGTPGNAMGNLSRPKGVAEDSQGHIYVVDSLFHNVQLFDASGSLLMHFGQQGSEPGEFWLPVGIFISDDDTIYLCDSYNQRVQIFKYIGKEQ